MKFKDVVSLARATAHTMPCQFAEQCINQRYFFEVYPAQGVHCVVGLTVNVGEE